MEEKFKYGVCFGCVRMCVVVDSSRARVMPRAATIIAVVFVRVGMVIGRVFVGVV